MTPEWYRMERRSWCYPIGSMYAFITAWPVLKFGCEGEADSVSFPSTAEGVAALVEHVAAQGLPMSAEVAEQILTAAAQ